MTTHGWNSVTVRLVLLLIVNIHEALGNGHSGEQGGGGPPPSPPRPAPAPAPAPREPPPSAPAPQAPVAMDQHTHAMESMGAAAPSGNMVIISGLSFIAFQFSI